MTVQVECKAMEIPRTAVWAEGLPVVDTSTYLGTGCTHSRIPVRHPLLFPGFRDLGSLVWSRCHDFRLRNRSTAHGPRNFAHSLCISRSCAVQMTRMHAVFGASCDDLD